MCFSQVAKFLLLDWDSLRDLCVWLEKSTTRCFFNKVPVIIDGVDDMLCCWLGEMRHPPEEIELIRRCNPSNETIRT